MTEVIKIHSKESIKGKNSYKNYLAPDISEKVLNKLIINFDRNLDKVSVIAYFDNTLFDTSNGGLLFAKDGF